PQTAATGASRAAVATFFLLAVVQNQDVLLAARVLPAGDAARFAALSTLGGVAAFATATVPLVLLPRAVDQPRARGIALGVAAALGAVATALFAVAPGPLVELVFGDRYASTASLAALYVLGMSVLGVARVLAADSVARGRGRAVVATTAVLAVAQTMLVVRFGTSTGRVAAITIGTTAALATALATVTVIRLPVARHPGASFVDRVRTWRWQTPAMITAFTLGALALRLLVTRGLWVDEAISVHQAGLPFGTMLARLADGDVHPPLHAALLWVTVRVVGDGELAVRLPSIAAGVALVPLLYATGRELFDRRTGLVAAALGAVAPLAVWYSQEARMYSLYMLFALAAVWAQARALRRGGTSDWALYGVATAALLWTQYFAVLQVAAQQAVFAVALWRRRREGDRIGPSAVRWLGALALVALLVVPLLPFLGDQLQAYADRGAGLTQLPSQAGNAASAAQSGLSVYAVIANLIWATGGYHADATMAQIAALWPLGMLAALLLLGRRRSPEMTGLLVITLVPVLVLFAVGLQRRDLFELRYVAGVVPALLLLGARAMTTVTLRRMWTRAAACTAVIVLLLGALADQQLNGTNPRLYDFRGALQEVAARAEPGDVILYNPDYLDEIVRYYAPGVDARSIGANRGKGAETGRVFLLGSFLDKREIAGATGDALGDLERERQLVDEFEVPQVRVWVFGSRKA
ncbi:MAG: glycosyltransferase family 39 protein, partial [Acidimicrobiia bacterium]